MNFLFTFIQSRLTRPLMNRNRLIFYAVFAVFHIFLVIFSFYIDSQKDDFNFMLKILNWVSLLKWGAVLGFILVSLDVIWSWIINRDSQTEKGALIHELNTLKAKLFDLQETAKGSTPPKSPSQK